MKATLISIIILIILLITVILSRSFVIRNSVADMTMFLLGILGSLIILIFILGSAKT